MPMRQLRSCDFCGGDAAGVYEVLPPELSPTEAEQRRLVLCSDCAETLETVVNPLLERLGVETGDAASAADDGSPASGETADAEPTPAASSPAEPTTSDPDSPPTSDPDSPPASEPANSDTPDYGIPFEPGDPAESPADRSTAGDPAEDGTVRWDEAEPTTAASEEAGSPASDRDDGSDEATEPAGDADGPAATPDGHAADRDGSEEVGEEPEEFRTVMRLLGNRDFPVERGAIVELATNAYELDERHVGRIIDHAVDRGVIVDDGGTLRRN